MTEKEALENLVTKLEEIVNSKAYINVFAIAQVHGFSYNGPSFEKELEDAKIVLGK